MDRTVLAEEILSTHPEQAHAGYMLQIGNCNAPNMIIWADEVR